MRNDAIGFFWKDEPVIREKKEAPPKRQAPERTWERPGYYPGLEQALAYKPAEMTLQELLLEGADTELLYDVEVYRNFFCVTFESLKTGRSMYFELSEWSPTMDLQLLEFLYTKFVCVGFNNISYDSTMMSFALAGKTPSQMKDASDDLIAFEMRPRDVLRKHKVKRVGANEYDLIEVAPLFGSLKIYGGRLHTPQMQDLPFPHNAILDYNQSRIVKYYNHKDLVNTRFLRLGLDPQIKLRHDMSHMYGIDLRSRSDAQIAESVITEEIEKLLGYRPKQPEIAPGTVFKYKDPGFLKFRSELMNWVFARVQQADFVVAEHGGIGMPEELADLKVHIGDAVYRMGIGGLHSTESKRAVVASPETRILDRDVTSFYPYIILNQGLYPSHLGPHFLTVYRGIVERRVDAKAKGKACAEAGDKDGEAYWAMMAESLKIVVNGSYGKLGSKYSVLYAPDLLIQTTLTGQLSLLMLIERLELSGIRVISANTDGITAHVPKAMQDIYETIVAQWERDTSFETEETEYTALYSRDVNNYIAVKKAKPGQVAEVKTKGFFANPWTNKKKIEPWMHKNPQNQICIEAVTELLVNGTPIEKTINGCRDITKFVNVRKVKDGAVVTTKPELRTRTPSEKIEFVTAQGYAQHGSKWYMPALEHEAEARPLEQVYSDLLKPEVVDYLGVAIRWYYAKDREDFELVYAKNGNRVPRSEGCKPCMDLPEEFPEDMNFDWYINETNKVLKQICYM